MTFDGDELQAEEGSAPKGARKAGNGGKGQRLPKPVRLVGRPDREKIIGKEDMLNLRIILGATRSVDEFIASLE